VYLPQRHDGIAAGQDDVWGERDQLSSVFTSSLGIACAPSMLDPHVVAVRPARLLQALQEGCETSLP
jgi:hypothetical protein